MQAFYGIKVVLKREYTILIGSERPVHPMPNLKVGQRRLWMTQVPGVDVYDPGLWLRSAHLQRAVWIVLSVEGNGRARRRRDTCNVCATSRKQCVRLRYRA
jgi:hypothetical protein